MDWEQIGTFFERDYVKVVGALGFVTGSPLVAEDCVMEALVRVCERSRRGVATPESLPAYVTTMAMNLARSGWRRRAAERRALARLDGVRATVRNEPDSDTRLDVMAAVRGLPRRQREVVVLRYYLGHDVADVARILGVTDGTVKTCLFRARNALAAALACPAEIESVEP
jgi:RNA polymerase sigma factor (sigma-70 family)